VNLDDANDVQQAHAILSARLPTQQQTASANMPSADACQRWLDNLWPRLGQSMRRLVKETENYPGRFNIEQLATALGRPLLSVRNSMNGPLAKALDSTRKAVPDGPRDIYVWYNVGTHYEAEIYPPLRTLLKDKGIDSDFNTIPRAS
jgi:hypothetical protein